MQESPLLAIVLNHNSFNNDNAGHKKGVQRNYDGSISTIGKYIASVQFSRQGSIIVVGITASPEGRTETAEQSTYYVYLQSKETPVR